MMDDNKILISLPTLLLLFLLKNIKTEIDSKTHCKKLRRDRAGGGCRDLAAACTDVQYRRPARTRGAASLAPPPAHRTSRFLPFFPRNSLSFWLLYLSTFVLN